MIKVNVDDLLKYSGSLVIVLTADFRVVALNSEVERFFRWQQNEIVDLDFIKLCERYGFQSPIYPGSLKSNEKLKRNIDSSIHMENGVSRVISWDIFSISEGENIMMMGHDVTEKRMNNALNGSLFTYFKQVIDSIPYSIFWKDRDSVFLGCNKNFALSAGLSSSKEIIGKTDFDLPWGREEGEAYRHDDREVMSSRKTKLNIEEPQTTKTGKKITLLTSKVPLYDSSGDICGVFCIYTDITELKNTQLAFHEAKIRAEESDRAKSEFIRDMEHDIRTPCSSLWGLSDLLARKETEPGKKELLSDIATCAKELLDYSNSILDFSKIENGLVSVYEKPFNLERLIKSVVQLEALPAKYKSLTLSSFYDPRLAKVVIGDAYRVKRILINLVGNAIKFTESGTVSISVHLAKQDKNGRRIVVMFEVNDTGIGIPDEKKYLIYERFSKIAPSYKGTYKGQGLGLHIVNRFVNELDGDIHLHTELNKGSKFKILLPFKIPLSDEILEEKT